MRTYWRDDAFTRPGSSIQSYFSRHPWASACPPVEGRSSGSTRASSSGRSHPGRTIEWRRYLTVIQRNPGDLLNGAPFVALLGMPWSEGTCSSIQAASEKGSQAHALETELDGCSDQDAHSQPSASAGRWQGQHPVGAPSQCGGGRSKRRSTLVSALTSLRGDRGEQCAR